ncbi:MAG: hypothetical protein JWN04_559 [Myxococcaceae bacterium]|nr:hypothetical protein [Myxococcaceae bacterium]
MGRAWFGLVTLTLYASACTSRLPAHASTSSVASEFGTPPAHESVSVPGLRNVQRTLGLLASSTAAHRNHVRVLFYGQSITQSPWSRKVESELRRRFPLADLEVENRALAGFASNLLVKTAESDLYPYSPDLVIFHVYGAHDRYEDLVRRVHERTTSEILLQTDHVLSAGDLTEQTDPAQLSPRPEIWNAFMNNAFLPGLVERYQTALCDVRSAWKRHLTQHAEPPEELLSDGLHLNARGDALMAHYVEQCLQPAPEVGASPAERWVTTLVVGQDLHWQDGKLTLPFEGNRVDAITSFGQGAPSHVRIDGEPPSQQRELYTFARARCPEAGAWPPLFELSSNATPLLETMTLEVTRVAASSHYAFTVHGDRTGPDGEGTSDRRFESNSKRLAIDPEDWNVEYAFKLAAKPIPEHFTIELRVVPHFADTIASRAADSSDSRRSTEHAITIAQGLANTAHVLELSAGGNATPNLRALRIYRPPLGRL